MEAHPKTGTGAPAHHFVCLNLPHPFELARDLPAQTLIDKVIEAGGKVIYAHPYWTAHSLEEMTEVSGYIGVEVFNAVCHLRWNKGHGSVHWDQLLNKGRLLPAVATDDVHKTSESCSRPYPKQKNSAGDRFVRLAGQLTTPLTAQSLSQMFRMS